MPGFQHRGRDVALEINQSFPSAYLLAVTVDENDAIPDVDRVDGDLSELDRKIHSASPPTRRSANIWRRGPTDNWQEMLDEIARFRPPLRG
ncbi:MAG: hypothetical protein QGF59_27180 [Pirellulaceae bacterium]|nr:hypothetical protein [Pirellulaceae bacterium]